MLFGGLTDEASGNVVLFVPFGLLFPLVAARWRWFSVPLAVGLSAAIELTQHLLSWRTPSIDDVKWNSLGALIGFSLWLMAWTWRRRNRAPASPT